MNSGLLQFVVSTPRASSPLRSISPQLMMFTVSALQGDCGWGKDVRPDGAEALSKPPPETVFWGNRTRSLFSMYRVLRSGIKLWAFDPFLSAHFLLFLFYQARYNKYQLLSLLGKNQ